MASRDLQVKANSVLKKIRNTTIIAAAIGAVLVDSASHVMSIIFDFFFVGLLLLAVYWKV